MTELGTERLVLRHWRAADAEPFAAMNADREVMRHFPGPLERQDSDALLRRIASELDERDWGLWALEERGSGLLLGFTGLSPVPFPAPFAPGVEIGWRLVRSHWGRGLASEAARASLAHGFGELALAEIVSFTFAGNERSRAVMRRIGMTRDPAGDFEHPLIPEGHRLRPHVLYRLRRPGGGQRR
ncbi:MAG: Acetyltransferase, GNAT family [uncultured Solirubrobacteraceae bacterium]|uniref:Acetyltransferase, GNAT family n=1 Tax=uncultured Solirubrobacteraceae bacterium TaxID=1162706 RepID=A0A6J4S2J5_9ACTN|nr:MAG: Acetyltransferase, GNAT family [uncultured Solirubrobacteraceae bacterium]